MELPKKYKHDDVEARWAKTWDDNQLYQWKAGVSRDETFSVDTPPPTVSGSLHIGHVFSYTHTDAMARFQRMQGKNVFYPMGWDDNGLPTERRVQQVYGITCKPELAYDSTLTYTAGKAKKPHEYTPVSRQNFIEACAQLTQEDEKVFEALWRKLGLSVDWSLTYATIDDHCREVSQRSFLDCVDKGRVYSVETPCMWDTDFQTAVAQAEIEDRDKPGAYHHLSFGTDTGTTFEVATTRPELLASCIAVVAHPEDERYKALFGTHAITPLFGAKVPIVASTHADPEKGTGILMVCTFGDNEDVQWWKQSDLPIKQTVGRDGCLLPVVFGEAPFESENVQRAQGYYDQLVGKRVKKARQVMVELLQQDGSASDGVAKAMQRDIEAIEHPVKFYEKGDNPVEFMSTRQWFISLLDQKEALVAQGNNIDWHPPYMKTRYQHWVEGLNQDWCISRQRYFGVPFPVWYPVNEQGEPDYDAPIFATQSQLPVDPQMDVPAGFTDIQRNQPGGFMADPDVMDTWATSSLTPQLMSRWGADDARHKSVFPFDIRPQSHEIIRTWAFYTIVKAWIHEEQIPWHHVVISGWVLDPDRKKMSKSKGNVVTPEHLLDQYSSDAVRYWACKARLGTDTAMDERVFATGQKLTTKLFNAAKFVLMQTQEFEDVGVADVVEPVDVDWMGHVNTRVKQATAAYHQHDYATALDETERLFWLFCDQYIELVKVRAYREEEVLKRRSACGALRETLSILCRLFAPVFPFITEEIWSWAFTTQSSSVHVALWPKEVHVDQSQRFNGVFDVAVQVMDNVRATKTQAQKSMKFPVSLLTIVGTQQMEECLTLATADIIRAGTVETIDITVDDSVTKLAVNATLADHL